MTGPNFDDWAALFEKDPEEFERKRKEFIDNYIEEQWADDPDRIQRYAGHY